jgi:putative ABC transport system ATP-binding protein
MADPFVQCDQVSLAYTATSQQVVAVDDVDLLVNAATTVALTGPSGSGKSSLLHLIGAMERPTSGTITVGGRQLNRMTRAELTDYRRTIGFVFQAFHLLPALTALDNVMAPVLPRRTPYDKRQRALELLDSVGLGNRALAMPSELSGGQRQRVAIARALIQQPDLLLADEPTGNLDTTASQEVLTLLVKLREDRGLTLIVATHDAAIASACDRIVSLIDGRIAHDSDETTHRPRRLLQTQDKDTSTDATENKHSHRPSAADPGAR